MAPFSHTLFTPSGILGTRPSRLDRAHSFRLQTLGAAEAQEQTRNILSPEAVESARSSGTAECSTSAPAQNRAFSSDVQTSISDRLLQSNLAGSVSEWLENFGTTPFW